MGKNYPTALSCALEDLTGKKIETPNDLLGISYIKTILENNYKIIPETIKRTNDYHSTELDNEISSATSIREALKNNQNIDNQVPKETKNELNNLHFIDDYFNILKYKIITEKDLSIYQTVDEGIDNLLKKEISNCNSYDELIKKIKSKRYTYNKISRMLIHILCNFTKEKREQFNDIKYIRILGLNKKGSNYLNTIKKELEIETTKIYDINHNENLVKREFERIIYKGEE